MPITGFELNLEKTSLASIFKWCLDQEGSSRLLMTTRELMDSRGGPRKPNSRVIEFVEQKFGKYLINTVKARCWPGTELVAHQGIVFLLNFNEEIADCIVRIEPNATRWLSNGNPYPEDFCLYKPDSHLPSLVTCTHEAKGWLLTEKQLSIKGAKKMGLSGSALESFLLIPKAVDFISQ